MKKILSGEEENQKNRVAGGGMEGKLLNKWLEKESIWLKIAKK